MERDAAESPGESVEGGAPGRAPPVPERQQGDVEPATLEAGPRKVLAAGASVADVDQGAAADLDDVGEILGHRPGGAMRQPEELDLEACHAPAYTSAAIWNGAVRTPAVSSTYRPGSRTSEKSAL